MQRTLFTLLLLGLISLPTSAMADAYDDWDMNNDQVLSEDEIYNGFEQTGFFYEWDDADDGYLDENEFYNGVYGYYDDNDDGWLDDDEWDDAGDEGLFDI